MCANISLKFGTTHFMVVILLIHVTQVSGQELNQILNIFSPCYTDLIFSKSIDDIPSPEYPILVSTPRKEFSVTPPTIRMNESLVTTWHFLSDLRNDVQHVPMFETRNTVPQLINVRLNCVALVILNATSREDIRRSVRNRHNWIHFTVYPFIDDI